jgi:hypothetical protein
VTNRSEQRRFRRLNRHLASLRAAIDYLPAPRGHAESRRHELLRESLRLLQPAHRAARQAVLS